MRAGGIEQDLLSLLILILLHAARSAVKAGEINQGLTCPAGTYISCYLDIDTNPRICPNATCLPCPVGEYNSKDENVAASCSKCATCSGPNQEIKWPCTHTSDAKCGCREGYSNVNPSKYGTIFCVELHTNVPIAHGSTEHDGGNIAQPSLHPEVIYTTGATSDQDDFKELYLFWRKIGISVISLLVLVILGLVIYKLVSYCCVSDDEGSMSSSDPLQKTPLNVSYSNQVPSSSGRSSHRGSLSQNVESLNLDFLDGCTCTCSCSKCTGGLGNAPVIVTVPPPGTQAPGPQISSAEVDESAGTSGQSSRQPLLSKWGHQPESADLRTSPHMPPSTADIAVPSGKGVLSALPAIRGQNAELVLAGEKVLKS